jgi:uncharacterized tellurite resistance protein B-like protein
MLSASEPSDWSVVHDVALLYLALAHGTDLEIAPSEQMTMVERLNAWYPDEGPLRIQRVLQEVMLTYLGEHSREMVDAAVASIKMSMSKQDRIGVLNDLADLATADGTLVPGEISFIQQLARYWEVEGDLW